MNTFERFLGVGALALLFSAGVFADTLELKDGRTLRGKYLGGTQVIMRFEVDGDVQTFRVSEVSNLSFDRHSRRGDRQDDGNPPPPPPDQAGPSNQPGQMTLRLRRTNHSAPMINALTINRSNRSPMTTLHHRLPLPTRGPTSAIVTATTAIRIATATTIVTAIANPAVNPTTPLLAPASPFPPAKPCSFA
jgi:hypothetical protein